MFARWLRLLLLTAFVGLPVLGAPSLPSVEAAAGDLDLSFGGFGSQGKVTITGMQGGALALYPDGRIVVAGHSGNRLLVRRYHTDGRPDHNFGVAGLADIPFTQLTPRVTSVAVQPDGKLVVAGFTESSHREFLAVRLTTHGQLDTPFGSGGAATTRFPYGNAEARAVVVQADGKIVLGGVARVGDDDDFAVVRYTALGQLDNQFDQDGIVTIGFGGDDQAHDMLLLPDGRIVLAGQYSGLFDTDFALASLNPNDGSLDETFDGDGKMTIGFGEVEWADRIALDPEGRIVVMDSRPQHDDLLLARVLLNGKLDNTFGNVNNPGKLVVATTQHYYSAFAIQPDGKFLFSGQRRLANGTQGELIVHRTNTAALLDSTFGASGAFSLHTAAFNRGQAMALQPDGRLIVLGTSGPDSFTTTELFLLRLWPDAAPDLGGQQTWAVDAAPTFPPGSDEVAYGMALDGEGRLLLVGEVRRADNAASDAVLARFQTNGQPDTAFGTHGRVLFGIGRYDTARAVAVQPDGKIVVGGYSDPPGAPEPNFLVARFLTVAGYIGAPDPEFGFAGLNVADFADGADFGHALALAPDGKIVVAGNVWNGNAHVWGVARFTAAGVLDNTFDQDGKVFINFNHASSANAVAVLPDGKILVAGHVAGDFAVVRLTESGGTDYSFGPGNQGFIIHDAGGADEATALVVTPGGVFYTAGYRDLGGGNRDFALAQYQPHGVLNNCADFSCIGWSGMAFVDFGGNDAAVALDYRPGDGRVAAAGCHNGQFAWAQLGTGRIHNTIKFTTDFAGVYACATGVKFVGADRLVLAGLTDYNGDQNFALARFETSAAPLPPPPPQIRLFLPLVVSHP
jgi:uncharacterized delta-60 repeat protein